MVAAISGRIGYACPAYRILHHHYHGTEQTDGLSLITACRSSFPKPPDNRNDIPDGDIPPVDVLSALVSSDPKP